MSTQYEPDEFDKVIDSAPRGVHRAPEPWWRWLVPFLIVIVAVPVLAWGAMYLMTAGGSSDESASKPPAATTTEVSTAEGEGETEEAPAPPDTNEPGENLGTPEGEEGQKSPEPNKADVKIQVLNGAKVAGLAGRTAKKLEEAGYKAPEATNANGWASQTSVVYYPDEALKPAAEKVAETLGIKDVKFDNTAQDKQTVVVLLRKDYQE
ncbi:hypothetical protein BK816_06850 [Boudabousia tangfeifanii]|uniref:LytR/CpsA/Psr regulator C-terminal domain-containing protein n=1 Tax=Boudabousia tangfeifanii TaxID=1912795 RepID=A0A1D9MLH1_9ACTO|nr:LytR C-terminal domain-containing protein [Boudabousia tangfeifanii]AOZ73039.1 hypothetical protein BK816_06850 [Boudabousia tangfeifanii]